MNIRQILSTINDIAESNGYAKPYLVGGVVRDKALNRVNRFNDLDITNGDETIKNLALKSSFQLDGKLKQFPDGHISVHVKGLKLDFSSNYRAPGIRRYLQKYGVADPTDLQEECFSRDFTINSMLWDLNLSDITDPTGLGMVDLQSNIIRTCLPARMTLTDNPKRVVRAIYLAAKLGFDISEEIIEFVKNNKDILINEKNNYSRNKLVKASDYDLKRTVKYLTIMGLWDSFEIPEGLMDIKARFK